MISQHLQAAIAEMQEFIDFRPDARSCEESIGSKTGLSRLQV